MRKHYFGILVGLLLLTNVLTVLYYRYKIHALRQESSFVVVAKTNSGMSFKECLDRNRIENKLARDKIMVREVDEDPAIALCS